AAEAQVAKVQTAEVQAPDLSQEPHPSQVLDSLGDGLNQRMALELRDMDIVDALKFLAMKSNVNIIAGKDVVGRASIFLKDVTIKDGLEIILQANNLAYERRGNILYVMTEAEYKLLHGESFKDTRLVRTINLKYTKPEAIFKALEIVKSDIGKIIVDEESGTVILVDTAERIGEMEKIVGNLDQPTLTRTFALQYAKAKEVQAVLNSRLDAKKTGTVVADERNNQVIVTAFPSRVKEAEEIIKGLDRKTKQVLLEVRVLKVILKDNFNMGIKWEEVWAKAQQYGISLADTFSFPSTLTTFFRVAVGNNPGQGVSGFDYSAIVAVLQEFGETRNLSSPSIAVINGHEAKIHIGRTEAYVTTTIATGSTTSSTAAQVTFMDVGVQLTVTPTINDEGYITMRIAPDISNVDGSLTYKIAADVENTVPLVAHTTAETTVMVKDGNTVMIGGLRKDEKTKTVDKLPFLGDLPLAGAAFRKAKDDLEKSEIVVFITPHIMTEDSGVKKELNSPKGLRGYENEPADQ
ncbi:MAG: secretin and TonB N-terminal domain-containing protein, partial [Candidatus Omnitrophica bacterium]|nr:secretin and TonB N-terminal domain-containing protein [Candidatus Omnitrophota bacterium]